MVSPGLTRLPGRLQTARGEGQWLSSDVFGFWSQANYRRSSNLFAWVGLARIGERGAVLEVRVLRGSAIAAARLPMLIAGFMGAAVASGWPAGVAALVPGQAICWWWRRSLHQEKPAAREISGELCRKFEGERGG